MSDNYVDFSDIYKALGELGKDLDREANKIMNDIAPEVAEEFSKRVPYWSNSKAKMSGKRGSYMGEHMRDHVIYSKAKDGYVEIGFMMRLRGARTLLSLELSNNHLNT